jgi:hypothetical protein
MFSKSKDTKQLITQEKSSSGDGGHKTYAKQSSSKTKLLVAVKDQVPEKAKIISSTWDTRKKSNGIYRARLNAKGYEQVDGVHFDSTIISSPVPNDTTVKIVLVLSLIFGWTDELVDVHGAFLYGIFQDEEQIYMSMP